MMGRPKDTASLAERFWSKVLRKDPDDCWEWRAGKFPAGYGCLKVDGRSLYSHRLAWELTHGIIPAGEGYHGTCVRHKCDNRGCCNPRHLELGSVQENNMDRDVRRRTARRPGETNAAVKLSDLQVEKVRHRLRTEYVVGIVTQREIASDCGVTNSLVSYIHRHPEYRHV
jgi:hypothetical protein